MEAGRRALFTLQSMEEMKHQDGFAPYAEETAKLNEMVTWLVDHGYNGIVLIHKGEVGVSWMHVKDAEEVRHTFINSLGHIMEESVEAATDLARGMALAVKQISE